MAKLNLIATSTFGLEATVKREVQRLGFDDIKVSDGRIDFSGDLSAIPRANIWLRSADRVYLVIGEFKALTFDELFEGTKALPWDEWIPKDGKFTVIVKSVKSQLFSVSDCQAIVKKAVVEKLKQKYKVDWFEETGAEYKIQVGLLRDVATLVIDTSGAGLHKRGYRQDSVIAPIKETLAAAMIELSYWRKDRVLLDPMCGSGTIPVEAAMMAKNIAPGLTRNFASEEWQRIGKKIWQQARDEANDLIDKDAAPEIYASDISRAATDAAKQNAIKADVKRYIKFETKPFNEVTLPTEYGVAIMNPPYGERIGEKTEVDELYRDIGKLLKDNRKWSTYVITSNEEFEKFFGRRADAKRKLFNGMLKTDYYQYYGERPPKMPISREVHG
ncbi:MAG: class I SAM-dependent RNA methyltransferase [Clostridiales bacterium]|jgi:putative N6-adenine-specific DNA methylase|nr:class I SAM-dependent RNA methyltransferase [Clostridiales bacterium]